MRRVNFRSLGVPLVAGLWLGVAAIESQAAVIAQELERAMALRGTHADTAVILRFTDPLELQPFAVTDRRARDNRLMIALKARTAQNLAAIEPLLTALGALRIRDLWIINGLAATVPALAVKQLAAHPRVERIELDSLVQSGRSQRTPQPRTPPRGSAVPPARIPAPAPEESVTATTTSAQPGWNISAVHVPELWALGQTGKGVVVATMDTGVDLGHPDLRRKWRGGANSWFDPHGEEAAPYDALGHGTQAMGVIVGGAALGIAPDARWIAVKLYDGAGRASMSDIHLAFQWLMDPDGNPATIDAPDIVNASWTLTGRAVGACNLEFSEDIRALKSAGIAIVFAAGNDGPSAGTSNSPANNPGALSIGAVNRSLAIARQTSRGPSACDGAVFPRLVAPGVNVRTADLSHGGLPSYTTVSGSSLAAPHAAGVLALLAGAFPEASVAELEAALVRGAHNPGDAGKANGDAYGFTDALAAFNVLWADRRALNGATVDGIPDVPGSPSTSQPLEIRKRVPDARAESAMHQR